MRDYEDQAKEILEKWEKSEISDAEVFLLAESVIDNNKSIFKLLSSMEKGDKLVEKVGWEAIPAEIIMQLQLRYSLATKHDIPVFEKFLSAKQEKSPNAWKEWDHYWEILDWSKRRNEVAKVGWPYPDFDTSRID